MAKVGDLGSTPGAATSLDVKTSLSRFLITTNGALLWTGGFTGAEHGANETLCVRVLV